MIKERKMKSQNCSNTFKTITTVDIYDHISLGIELNGSRTEISPRSQEKTFIIIIHNEKYTRELKLSNLLIQQ